jgi:hypothetical protein
MFLANIYHLIFYRSEDAVSRYSVIAKAGALWPGRDGSCYEIRDEISLEFSRCRTSTKTIRTTYYFYGLTATFSTATRYNSGAY